MPELPDERARLLKMTMPAMPILPVDLYSRGTDMSWAKFKHTTPQTYIHNYPKILDLKVCAESGVYDIVGLTNWRDKKATRTISLPDKLGLAPNTTHVVFDFWNQKLLDMVHDTIKLDIEPHDTRVLSIHSLTSRPQLIGTSRHISGAYSILGMDWDRSRGLSGTSKTVPGDEYSLFIYIPEGYTLKEAHANDVETGHSIPVETSVNGNLLKINLTGRANPVKWSIRFDRN